MGDLVAYGALAGALVAVLVGLVLLGRRARRRGVGAALLGPLEEIYHPGAHRARLAVEVQSTRAAPEPGADAPPGA